MKRFALLLGAIVLLLTPLTVFASDIGDADYSSVITISNNSTATTNVATTMELDSDNLLNQAWVDSLFSNCAVRNSSGSDVPFMPGVNSSYPWCFWVPTIGEYTNLNYILYLGGSNMSSLKYYFPGSTGMTTSDSPTFEFGSANFTLEQTGWVNATISDDATYTQRLVHKQGAFISYLSASGNITSSLLSPKTDLVSQWTSATSVVLYGANWTGQTFEYPLAFDLDHIEVGLDKDGAPTGDVFVGLWATDSTYAPTGDNFTFDSIPAASLAAGAGTNYSFNMTATLKPDTRYFIGLCAPSAAGGGDQVNVRCQVANPYAHGSRWDSINSGATWVADATDDLRFRIYGYAANTSVTVSGVSSGEIALSTNCTPNFLPNSSFEVGTPPSNWLSPNCDTARDNVEFVVGSYSVNITNAAGNFGSATTTIKKNLQNQKVTLGAWVKCPSTNVENQYLVLDDNVGGSSISAIIPKDDAWHWMEHSYLVNAAATEVYAQFNVSWTAFNANDVLYVDGAVLVIGSSVADGGNFALTADGTTMASWAGNITEINYNYITSNWTFQESYVMPYMKSQIVSINGTDQQNIVWEYNTVFADLSGNGHNATPTFRTVTSDPDVTASLTSFSPISTAIAPAFSVTDASPFITANLTASGNFTGNTTAVVGGVPGAAVVEAVAEAGGTPPIWLWGILGIFTLVMAGLGISYMESRYGSGGGTLLIRMFLACIVMSLLIAFGKYDWWMLVIYLFIAVAIAMASRHTEWGGNVSQLNLIGFLSMTWIGLTTINRILEGQFISSAETAFLNKLTFTQQWNIAGTFTIPVLNFEFFSEGLPRLFQWDYTFFGGNAQLLQYMLYSLTAVGAFIIFTLVVGLAYSYLNRLGR